MKRFIVNDKRFFQMGMRVLRWYFNYYIRRNPRPLIIAVFTTNLCNLNCDICSIWRAKPKGTLSLDDLKRIVDASSGTAAYISFSGGEPLLVPHIFDMISYASSRIPYTHLVSNGLLVSPDVVRKLESSGLTEVSISLDGERSWHNKTHGSENSYDGAINAIECFKKFAPRIHIGLDTVIYPEALDQTRKAVRISRSYGIFHKVQPVNKHFDFRESSEKPREPVFSDIDMKALSELVDFLVGERHVINSNYFLRNIPSYFNNTVICGPARPKCALPYFFLEVSAYESASPCMYATGWDGVVKTDSELERSLSGDAYRRRQKELETCRLCDKSMYMCYWEPLIQFPLMHALIYGLRR